MTDNKRYQTQNKYDNQDGPRGNFDANAQIKFNTNPLGSQFIDSNLDNFNLNNFNSRSSAINREIPKEAIKIVNDLFDDSVAAQSKRDQSFDFSILKGNKNDMIENNFNDQIADFKFKSPIADNKDDVNFSLFNENNNDYLNKKQEQVEPELNHVIKNDSYSQRSLPRKTFTNNPKIETLKPDDNLDKKKSPLNIQIPPKEDKTKVKNNNKFFDDWENNWDFDKKEEPEKITVNNRQNLYKDDEVVSENKINISNNIMITNIKDETVKNIPVPLNVNDKIDFDYMNFLPKNDNNNNEIKQKSIKSNKENIMDMNKGINFLQQNDFNSNNEIKMQPIKPNKENIMDVNKGTNFLQQNDINKFNSNNEIKMQPVKSNRQNIMEKNKEIDFEDILKSINLNDNKSEKKEIKKDFVFNNNDNNFQYQDDFINIKNFSSNNQPNNFNQYYNSSPINFNKPSIDPLGKSFNINLALEYDTSFGKSKVAKETQESVLKRKKTILEDNHFSSIRGKPNLFLENEMNLKPNMNLEEEALNFHVQVVFEDMLVNSGDTEQIKTDLDNYKLDEFVDLSPIGFLSELDKASVQTGLLNAEKCFREMSREINGWRMLLSDGNCFYRAFMFAFLENCILKKEVYKLRKIVYDLNENIIPTFKRKDFQINKNLFNTIFYFIIDFVESNKIREAYEILMKAYHRYQNFDYALIKYMRIAIAHYLQENQSSLINRQFNLQEGELLPSSYISKEGFNFRAFIEDNLLSMHNEASKLVIYMAPIVFNINMNLYVIEGVNDANNRNLNVFKQAFNCLLGENKLNNFPSTISLFYRFCHFDVLYTYKTTAEYAQIIPFSLFDKSVIQDGSKQRITILAEIPCDTCKRQSELLIFTHMPGMSICKLCLIDFAKKVVLKRTKNFSDELYKNIEYYCRPLTIDPQSNYMLYDEDLLLLIGKTIPQLFFMFLDQVCLFCQNSLQEKQSFILPCECRICVKCCDEKINQATGGKVLLNSFEKTYNKITTKPNCACGIPFDVEYAITISKSNLDVYLSKAKERLIVQAEIYCAMCRLKISRNHEDMVPSLRNKLIVVNEGDDNPNVTYTTHVLCKNCIITLKGDLMRLSKAGLLSNKTKSVPVKCSVCVKKTHQVELKNVKNLLKSEDGACCVIL